MLGIGDSGFRVEWSGIEAWGFGVEGHEFRAEWFGVEGGKKPLPCLGAS